MIKRVFFLTLMLMPACNSTALNQQLSSLKPNNLTSPALNTPLSVATVQQAQCNQEIPAELKVKLANYRLAQKSDFVASIRAYEQENPQDKVTCSIFSADFDQNNLPDYALLLVAKDNKTFHFTIALNFGDGQFFPRAPQTFKSITNPDEGIIYTSMSFKPAKSTGSANREYFPLQPGTPERKIFAAQPAIELWRALNTDLVGVPQNLEVSTLAYCTDIFYFDQSRGSELKTTSVCD